MYPQFEIRVNGDSSRFCAGQTIEGRVILVLHKEKIVRGITIRLVGKGNVFWDNAIKHNTVFSESETYLNTTVQLLVPEDGRHVSLSPGSYEYCFSFKLPHDIPSSLEGPHCFVRYYLEAAIQRMWRDDQAVEAVIHVTNIYDLSDRPETQVLTSIQKEKLVGFNRCAGKPLEFNFMLAKTGYVPGEYAQFGFEIRNNTTTKINAVIVYLKRQLSCHAKGETKSSQEKVLQVNGPCAEVGCCLIWQNNFQVPYLPPSQLLGCSIITIQYYVEIKLKLEKWLDIKHRIPIFIGSSANKIKVAEPLPNQGIRGNPLNAQSRTSSLRKNSSSVKSPITGEVFTYSDDENDRPETAQPARVPFDPEPLSTSLLPLDFTFFQNQLERSRIKSCEYTMVYPYRAMSNSNFNDPVDEDPPRPHSNPGHCWEKSVYWVDDT